MLAVWGRSWGLCWRSWAALGAYVGGLGPKNVKNTATFEHVLISEEGARSALSGAVLGRAWGLCGRSWAALRGLCWRSWAALGAYLRDLGLAGWLVG